MPPPPIPAVDPPRYSEDIDSTCSTPFVSAPSSPGHGPSGYFYSAPASPMHFILTNTRSKSPSSADYETVFLSSDSGSFEFEFSSRFSPNGYGGLTSMTSADELFFNGQIRPMKLSSHLATPQDGFPPPSLDLAGASSPRGRDPRLRSANRRARSMSPLRFDQWRGGGGFDSQCASSSAGVTVEERGSEDVSGETTPSCSASSSRSSSSGRNSKKWIFLKDLLNRSKSEGREHSKERFWSAISFSAAKEKKTTTPPSLSPSSSRDEKAGPERNKTPASRKPANGVWRRRAAPSAHELHYTASRAQAAEMKRKTFLPYRPGLLGCLGFSSKSYGAFSGFTRNLNPISSR
ncbi:hypothetical protein SASPL_111065 [Salvia splendens]|uniref:Uncharacterized protein n=1 Tax=Salvia splendens TaxID=180675 RepID=A0A8X8Y605_SALSN|nr:uncharacterized protein LOC121798515 [Salvia splendens]KAG6426831.1 hypothetical protein SASPL_111065 [Salvia splendens]